MNKMTFNEFTEETVIEHTEPTMRPRHHHDQPPLVVQILSVLGFGAFSIVAVSLAFAAFWVPGFILAIIIAYTWSGSRTFGGTRRYGRKHAHRLVRDLAPNVSARRTSGNASFDAHRADMLRRLEQESRDFESFLTRLRDARDEMEFDQFMDDRAKAARDTDPSDDDDENTT